MKAPLRLSLPLLAVFTASAAVAAPPAAPAAGERAEARGEFLAAARATVSARSGDVFFLPRKYSFVSSHSGAPVASHVRVGGRVETIMTRGVAHGVPWSYDRDVPLVLWGPGAIRAGATFGARVSQQHLAPTLAKLIGGPAPSDARQRPLVEAFRPDMKRPRAVLTVAFDQGGNRLFSLHPGAAPFVERLKREGSVFTKARVSHLDMETGMGHVALGTGAVPREHGLPSNDFFDGARGDETYAFEGGSTASPHMLMSPSLGDVWLRATGNRALLLSYCYADRAAMGMGGHGAYFEGNKKSWVYWLDGKTGRFATNTAYYDVPEAVREASVAPLLAQFAAGWMGHAVKKPKDLFGTPALPGWEVDRLLEVIAQAPFGADDVPDLLYVSLKSTDSVGHQFGQESEEMREVLSAQDAALARLVQALERKVGREHLVVAFSADHGAPPLTELSGGSILPVKLLKNHLNARFDRTNDGLPTVQAIGGAQLWIDEAQLALAGATLADVKAFLAAFRVEGKPFFEAVVTRDELR